MTPGSKLSVSPNPEGPQIARLWHVIHSFFSGKTASRKIFPSAIPMVALVVSDHDRALLTRVLTPEPMEIHFVESWEDARAEANSLTAPIILFDRDWPGTDWRLMVQNLAASPHQACVILMSAVADDYLWQELIRRGGYDLLAKPLRAENVARVVKLALSYWNSAPKPAVLARGSRK